MSKKNILLVTVLIIFCIMLGFILTTNPDKPETIIRPSLIPQTPATNLLPIPTAPILPPTMIEPHLSPTDISLVIFTLEPSEQDKHIIKILASDLECKLPCFLGIHPGISLWHDLRKVEGPVYYRDNYSPNERGVFFMSFSVNQENFPNLDILFIGTENIISKVKVQARIYPSSGSVNHYPEFATAMYKYSLQQILIQFGKPSRILVHAQGEIEPKSGTQAEILMFYDELGIGVHYLFVNVVTQDTDKRVLHVCPDYDHVDFIRLYLQNYENPVGLDSMISKEGDYYLSEHLQPIQKITNLSVESFHDMFSDPNENSCLDILY